MLGMQRPSTAGEWSIDHLSHVAAPIEETKPHYL